MQTREEAGYKFHAFLSHNRTDKEWTRDLVQRLRQAGLSVFFDEDSISLGEDVPLALERAIIASRHVFLILSPEAISSRWVALEMSTSLYRDPNAAERTIIPIILRDCEIPLLIARINYLDARNKTSEECATRVVACIDLHAAPLTPREERSQGAKPRSPKLFAATSSPVTPSKGAYAFRKADYVVRKMLDQRIGLGVIWGQRMIGKTSLLLAAIEYARASGITPAHVDMQAVHGSDFATVLFYVERSVRNSLGLREKYPYNRRSDSLPVRFRLEKLIKNARVPLLITMDEVEYLTNIGATTEFFSFIRALYNQLVIDNSEIVILISSYMSPKAMINDNYTSPFDIGIRERLTGLSNYEIKTLAGEGEIILDDNSVDRVAAFSGGQPIIVNEILSKMAQGETVVNAIEKASNSELLEHLFYNVVAGVLRVQELARALHEFNHGVMPDHDSLQELTDRNILCVNALGELIYSSDFLKFKLGKY